MECTYHRENHLQAGSSIECKYWSFSGLDRIADRTDRCGQDRVAEDPTRRQRPGTVLTIPECRESRSNRRTKTELTCNRRAEPTGTRQVVVAATLTCNVKLSDDGFR